MHIAVRELDVVTWLVEIIDSDEEEILLTTFHGTRAKERAEEYAKLKNKETYDN